MTVETKRLDTIPKVVEKKRASKKQIEMFRKVFRHGLY